MSSQSIESFPPLPDINRRRSIQLVLAAISSCAVPLPCTAASSKLPTTDVKHVLARAQSARGMKTHYDFGSGPPSPSLMSWPANAHTDCSGFVAWCFGLGRYPPQYGGAKVSTDAIYLDADRETGNQLFCKIRSPQKGGIVVYPYYVKKAITRKDCKRAENANWCSPGHVAIISQVHDDFSYETIECASTPFRDPDIRDAIAFNRGDHVFVDHIKAMSDVRRNYPEVLTALSRDPIFARYIGMREV